MRGARLARLAATAAAAAAIFAVGSAAAQTARGPFARLPTEQLDVLPPSARVTGGPGEMQVTLATCPVRPDAELRRRIVEVAVQEWGFFGFGVVDQTSLPDDGGRRRGRGWRPRSWLDVEESARVADTIAGYWSATADGAWILDRQNARWTGPEGIGARWRDPWSAAFISWVMCEAGLGERARFRRAIAHHAYIDQAIEARDGAAAEAAFVAYDVGEQTIEPGDLLCAARRPNYRRLDERRAAIGTGIRSHCDIVVELDPGNDRILVIGGNVRGAVSLKLHAAVFGADGASVASVGRGRRSIFAHLKLRAEPIPAGALTASPTVRRVSAADREWLGRHLIEAAAADAERTRATAPDRAGPGVPIATPALVPAGADAAL